MQKLSGTSSARNSKCYDIFHHKSNKIGFAFFWFFYAFLRNLQESVKWLYYLKFVFAVGTLEVLDSYIYAPGLHTDPQKELALCNWVPRGGQRRSGRNSGEVAAGTGGREREGPCGSPRARFACSEGVGRAASGVYRGSRRPPPLELLLRRTSGRGRAVGGVVSTQVT
jgi:hypothetical protein